jgi:hypothetical protein
MQSTDMNADDVRRLLLLQRTPLFANLGAGVLQGIAERAGDLTLSEGAPVGAPEGYFALVPTGTHASDLLAEFAPGLTEELAGSVGGMKPTAMASGPALIISTVDLVAAMEEEFSLYLAVIRALASSVVDAAMLGHGVFGEVGPMSHAPPQSLGLLDRVVCLRSTLAFGQGRVLSLVQLARQAAEIRADDGLELFRRRDAADRAILPVRGVLRGPNEGGTTVTLGRGSVLPLAETLARRGRWFTAVAEGAFVGLALPIERFLDVLEDQPELARELVRALAIEHLRLGAADVSRPYATGAQRCP